jgi:DNA adenine methylase
MVEYKQKKRMISYIGGKAHIGKWIKDYIPTDIETYVEPFSGMFWVFFNMDLSKYPNLNTVVYNDYNELNYNLLHWVKVPDVFHRELSKYPCQQLNVTDTPKEYEQMFYEYQKEIFDPMFKVTPANSLETACKYAYVLTQVFSGSKPETAKYMDYKGKYKCKLLVFMDKLKNPNYIEHFKKITFIENMDFEDVIKKYDGPKTYFYTDPPYFKTEKYYSNHDFGFGDHERLCNTLKSIQGKFSLSYYDFELLNKWLPKDQFNWNEKEFTKAASTKTTKNKGVEILINNF